MSSRGACCVHICCRSSSSHSVVSAFVTLVHACTVIDCYRRISAAFSGAEMLAENLREYVSYDICVVVLTESAGTIKLPKK